MTTTKRARQYRDTQTRQHPVEVAVGEETPVVGNGTCPGPALVLVVPMPPTLTNSGKGRSRHWRSAHNEKLDYWEFLDYLAMKAAPIHCVGPDGADDYSIPPRPLSPLLRVTVSSDMRLRGGMDEDGSVSRHKWLLDWLVKRSYIATDRRERKRDGACCRWAAFPTQHVTRRTAPRITLTLEPRV